MRLTVNQHSLIDFLMLNLDAETATIVYYYHGARLSYKEIAQRLYKECRTQVTKGANARIYRLLMRGREQILAAKPSEADLDNYPQIVQTAILNILARGKDPKKKGRSEVVMVEETPSKDDDGSSLHPATPSAHPNSCPRCQGNMLFETDQYGAYSTCLSCGYVYEPGSAQDLESTKELSHPSHGGKPL